MPQSRLYEWKSKAAQQVADAPMATTAAFDETMAKLQAAGSAQLKDLVVENNALKRRLRLASYVLMGGGDIEGLAALLIGPAT